MPQVAVKVIYLEMHTPPGQLFPPPRDNLTVIRARKPTVPYYRFLYQSVGGHHHWRSRKIMTDAELAVLIHDPRMENHVLFVDGVPAGFAELDRRVEEDIELVQFGLVPEFIGQGLGKYFLNWTIRQAWSYQPKRFWLHTCTLDHPTALPNYVKAGFTVFKEEIIQREIGS